MSEKAESRLILAFTASLALVCAPLIAQEEEQEHRRIVRSPVVVVGDASDHPHSTWGLVRSRAFLGVQTVDLTSELRQHFGVPPESGVMVAKIVEDSPAAESSLEIGDIITAVDGNDISSPSSLARAIANHDPGELVDLEVWRQGERLLVEVTLTERRGPVLDIRHFRVPEGKIETWSWTDDELEGAIELRAETLNRAIERLNEEMNSPEWHQRIHSFREHQSTLMKRIEELEERLRELETELGELSKED